MVEIAGARLVPVGALLLAIGCTAPAPEPAQGAPSRVDLALDTPSIEIDDPVNFTEVMLGESTKILVPVAFSSNACAEVEAGTLVIGWFDNADLPTGTSATCDTILVPLAFGDHQLTLALLTPDLDELANPQSRSSIRVRVTKPCTDNAECVDSFFCSDAVCLPSADGTKTTCKFGAPPFAKCCMNKLECTFGELCDTSNNSCVFCLDDGDCPGGPCGGLVCNGDGICEAGTPAPSCCDCDDPTQSITSQCNDGDPCTAEGCDCEANACTWTPACCNEDEECDDTNPCTADLCADGTCSFEPTEGGCPDGTCVDGECLPDPPEPMDFPPEPPDVAEPVDDAGLLPDTEEPDAAPPAPDAARPPEPDVPAVAPDSGSPDASSRRAPTDLESAPEDDEGGCGCRTAGPRQGAPTGPTLLLLALAALFLGGRRT